MEVDDAADAGGVAVSTLAAPTANSQNDDDDDWDPDIGSSVVLRPHLLQWTPTEKATAPKQMHIKADPLHDPGADDDDERWVSEQLLQPDSDNRRSTAAVLNCPGCFLPVCYQCQRHDSSRQWRAVEVRNCTVDYSAALSVAKGDSGKYFAVRCEGCAADVGVLDEDGIYHLFHVLDSVA